MAFIIKQGDTRPYYDAQLFDFFGTVDQVPIDLTAATSLRFLMRLASGGALKVNQPATFVDRVEGQVRYSWVALDTNTVGNYYIEFEITWNDGGVETIPNEGYLEATIVDDLDP